MAPGERGGMERILLVRLSALGDCVAAIPVFLALRRHFPAAHIAWAIQDNFAPLIQNLPGLDELVVFPRRRWTGMADSRGRMLREARAFARRLRMRRFDATVDVQSNTKSAMIAWLTRAPLRAGHGRGEAREISLWLNNRPVEAPPGCAHIFHRNLNLLTALGIEEREPRFELPPDRPAKAKMDAWRAAEGLEAGRYAVLVPFCGNVNKEWPGERFAALAERLAHGGMPAVFLRGPGRERETRALLPAGVETVRLGPETGIPEMVELIRTAGAAVGGDTGPLHIAGALGVKTAALFGPTDPARSRPWGPSAVFSLDTGEAPVAERILYG